MKPPNVYELTIPSSHKMSKTTAIVQSIWLTFPFYCVFVHNQTTQESEHGISRELPINEGDLSYLA